MAEGGPWIPHKEQDTRSDPEEARGLLDSNTDDHLAHESHDILDSPKSDSRPRPKRPTLSESPSDFARRQSSFAQPRPDGTPRTPNRVRFELMTAGSTPEHANGQAQHPSWMDEEDPLEGDDSYSMHQNGQVQRIPLLTDIEAPSVTVATDFEFDPEDHLESARPRSNMRSAFMNMANSIIGAGIIGQPYALKQAGLITGVILLVGLTFVVDWTIQLIVINSKLSGADSFQGTVQHCFGRPGMIAISVAQWAFAFGGMIAFCIIVGDSIPHVISALFPSIKDMHFLWLLADRRAVIALFILCLSYPLSLYKDIAKLAKASTLALISMGIIIFTVLTQGFTVPSESRGAIRGSIFINSGIFQAIGVISFAFVCHHNSLLIYGSLKKPTLDRFATVTHYSTGISMIACLLLALAGFLTFGDKTQGNVLNNFPSDNIFVNIARLCFGLNMLTTLPLECFVCREVMTVYYFPDEPFNQTRHIMFTTALVVSAMTLSLFTCDLGAVFELIGATSACALAYILPPLCYVKLSSAKGLKLWGAYACVAFGCIVMGISLILAVAKIINHDGEVKTCS
ncbi:putative amino acid transporter [Microthyrium microscopicum]|uniref:Putative amino acid transporter n=1 Tax=Microthyrium microscopicum TaxID=703497 RepID=A0A6A6ULP3_9PEZI|nr:putative amino acid transporter [Microthyrium microscopicum]